jgi:selenocysteine lyase/cysteine desulfurase
MYPENLQSMQEAEVFKNKIRKLIGANENDEVIFMSSCSEAMASVMHWISLTAPYGIICGTDYDHKTVQENAELYQLTYDNESLKQRILPDLTAGIMLTHVNPTTGEILDIESYMNLLVQYKYIDELTDNDEVYGADKLLQHRPVVMMDATQSIGKVNILMHGHKQPIDVIMASLHKLGFPLNFSGVLVLNASIKDQYIPLIAGAQQNSKRGGSYSLTPLLANVGLLDHKDLLEQRKAEWDRSVKYLQSRGLNVYTPKGAHLYNTILIDTNNHCPLELIETLAKEHGIYVGNKTACANEVDKSGKVKIIKPKNLQGGKASKDPRPFDNSVRISFIEPGALDTGAIKIIADEISKMVKEDEAD